MFQASPSPPSPPPAATATAARRWWWPSRPWTRPSSPQNPHHHHHHPNRTNNKTKTNSNNPARRPKSNWSSQIIPSEATVAKRVIAATAGWRRSWRTWTRPSRATTPSAWTSSSRIPPRPPPPTSSSGSLERAKPRRMNKVGDLFNLYRERKY